MTIGKRSEITAPIFVRLLLAFAAASVWTLFVAATFNVESGYGSGKGALTMLVLAAPLIVAVKAGLSAGGSYLIAFSTYFAVCFLATMYVWRDQSSQKPPQT